MSHGPGPVMNMCERAFSLPQENSSCHPQNDQNAPHRFQAGGHPVASSPKATASMQTLACPVRSFGSFEAEGLRIDPGEAVQQAYEARPCCQDHKMNLTDEGTALKEDGSSKVS